MFVVLHSFATLARRVGRHGVDFLVLHDLSVVSGENGK